MGSTSFGGTGKWQNAREFGCLTVANPSDFSSFQKTRFAAGGEALIHRNKRLLQKAEQD